MSAARAARRGTPQRRGGGTPLQVAARTLDKQISKASEKAAKLRKQADELDASVEPLRASRDALGDVPSQ